MSSEGDTQKTPCPTELKVFTLHFHRELEHLRSRERNRRPSILS